MEHNENRPHGRKQVQFENACPKSGISNPLEIGDSKPLFGRLRNLRASLTAYTFRMKHDIHKWASALQTTGGLLHCFKTK